MFPISKRAMVSVVAVCVLSLALSAVPAYAAGLQGFHAQDTTTVSIFSWSFWLDLFRPILSWTQGDDAGAKTVQADTPTAIFGKSGDTFEPDGVYAASPMTSGPTLSATGN